MNSLSLRFIIVLVSDFLAVNINNIIYYTSASHNFMLFSARASGRETAAPTAYYSKCDLQIDRLVWVSVKGLPLRVQAISSSRRLRPSSSSSSIPLGDDLKTASALESDIMDSLTPYHTRHSFCSGHAAQLAEENYYEISKRKRKKVVMYKHRKKNPRRKGRN